MQKPSRLKRRPLFQRSPLHQNKVKYKCNTTKPSMQMVNIFFFERNRSLPQKSITSKFNTIKHGGFDKYSSFSKRLALKKYSLSFPSGKKIKKYLPVWKMLTADQSVLHSVNEGNIPPQTPILGEGSKES